MKRFWILLILLAGCAGREARPIQVYQPGDHEMDCATIAIEMDHLRASMVELSPKTSKTGYNATMIVGGALVGVPFFFMDLKGAEKVEFEALRGRYNLLLGIGTEKDCPACANIQPVAGPKELRAEAKAARNEAMRASMEKR